MPALGGLVLRLVKSMAIKKAFERDKDGNSFIRVTFSIFVGMVIIIGAFLQWIIEQPLDSLKLLFSETQFAAVEVFKTREEGVSQEDLQKLSLVLSDDENIKMLSIAGINTDGSVALLAEANKHIGKPYVWGAVGPRSFDCSGFIYYSFMTSGIQSFPYRPNCRNLWNDFTVPIDEREVTSGDLIFFQGTQTGVLGATHVGIYMGGNLYIAAESKGVGIYNKESSWAKSHFMGFRRPKSLVKTK